MRRAHVGDVGQIEYWVQMRVVDWSVIKWEMDLGEVILMVKEEMNVLRETSVFQHGGK